MVPSLLVSFKYSYPILQAPIHPSASKVDSDNYVIKELSEVRPKFRQDEIRAEVSFHHGEDDTNVPAQHAKILPMVYREADYACTQARDTSLSSTAPSRRSWRPCSPHNQDAVVYPCTKAASYSTLFTRVRGR